MDAAARQAILIDTLASRLAAGGATLTQYETHLSRVLVTGDYAYKFKKALRLPFVDFSTLEARRFYCNEECRLNRRLAPALYIDVLPVGGSREHPLLGGAGPALEYAVRMHAFRQQDLWSARIAAGVLAEAEVDALARTLARLHREAAPAPPGSGLGSARAVAAVFEATLGELARLVGEGAGSESVAQLRQWQSGQQGGLAAELECRRTQGRVRECHGDLHCANILTSQDGVQVFDCIEFSDSLRWIDVMDDLAFVHMDLARRGRPDLAASLLNRYLEITGDYAGLRLLPYYRIHRALVRAKVMLLRAAQPGDPLVRAGDRREGFACLDFARRCLDPCPVALMITHGCSGSGKTVFSRRVVPLLGALQLRSDVERKRLYGLEPNHRPDAGARAALYGSAATQRTYAHLAGLAHGVLAAGWPVVVDAAFLHATERVRFRTLAAELGVPFFIVDMRVEPATMRGRIAARERAGLDASDADLAVLEAQLRTDEPLTPLEDPHAIAVDAGPAFDAARVHAACAPVLAALAGMRHGGQAVKPVVQAARIDPDQTTAGRPF